MPKILVLAEKPSVGKDIAKVLGCRNSKNGYLEGEKYIVTWAFGHLVTLCDPEKYDKKYEKWDLDYLPIIPKRMELEVISKTKKQFYAVSSLCNSKDVKEIVIATDAGREGELVARLILQKANVKKPLKRLWISSVTDKAIREGFQKLKDGALYENLFRSAYARASADWIVGINATRALTTKHNAQLSCGRVQTPTLAMISKREEDIKKFAPKDFYGISATSKGIKFTWQNNNGSTTFNVEHIKEILKKIENKEGKIVSINKTDKKVYPPLLYDLTSLQADANKMYNFSAKETLNTMQKLYENYKVLTYPRTDSKYLSSDIVDTIPERVRACSFKSYKKICTKLCNNTFSKNLFFVNNGKVTDHHAIIPTEQSINTDDLGDRERKIYELVVKRFLSALCPPFIYEETEITLKIESETFKAKGKRVKQLGYREVFSFDDEDDSQQTIPEIKEGIVKIDSIKMTTGKTTPPSLFNEATLLMAMENPRSFMETEDKQLIKTIGETGGIGTVATRADIIEKLFNSFLIEKRGKDIVSTAKGKQLLQLAPKELTSPELTAKWELRLIKISKGEEDINKFINEISEYTHKIIKEIKLSDEKFKHDNLTSERCPRCNNFMLKVNHKKGAMLACKDRECGYKKSLSIVTNARCENCHKKLELIGEGEKRKFVCSCGYKENYKSFVEKKEKEKDKMNKKDVQKFLKSQNKSNEKEFKNNALAKALEGLKL